jgi:hypothetical protein
MHDSVIKRISSAALSLHSVLDSSLNEQAESRVWEVVDELDAAIASIREAVFPT